MMLHVLTTRTPNSPPQTATPTSMSDADPSSPDPVPSTRRPNPNVAPSPGPGGLFTEGPNARSKSVTVADGHDTFGVSRLSYRQVQKLMYRHSTVTHLLGNPILNRTPLSGLVSVKTRTRDVGELWRILIVSFTTIVESGDKGTLPSSSKLLTLEWNSQLISSGHAGKHAAEWCGQNFHEVSYPSCTRGRELIISTYSTLHCPIPSKRCPTSSTRLSKLSTPVSPPSLLPARPNLVVQQ